MMRFSRRDAVAFKCLIAAGASLLAGPALTQTGAGQCSVATIQAMTTPDATITSAVPTAAPVPHCRVDGYVTTTNPGPNRVNFRLQLPDTGWNGRYYFIGMGATAGFVPTDSQVPAGNPLIKGFAVAGTDTGQQNRANWRFIGESPAQAIDYIHRGGHVTAAATQQITRKYYGREKIWRYHSGCSGGGRMGMEALAHHPGDYDGILLGAPGIGPTFGSETMLAFIYMGQQMLREPGAWVSPAKLGMLDKKVTAICDGLDGAEDGIIADNKACKVDMKQFECKAGDGADCLTAPERRTVEALLRGPRGPNGQQIKDGLPISNISVWSGFIGGPPPWDLNVDTNKMTFDQMKALPIGYLMGNSLAQAYFGKDYQAIKQFDFNKQSDLDAWWAAGDRLGYTRYSPDISAFQKQGGKIIFWNGESDPCCLVQDLRSYYNAVGKAVGGPSMLDAFARFYQVPGMAHCGSGTGPQDAPDAMLASLIDWVENKKAPASIVTHRGDRAKMAFADPKTGTVSGVIVPPSTGTPRDFLLCPDPTVATFNGKPGGESESENWTCKPRK
ncbi:tannase/feruloyl esterase family alpha/beta hydrolase [Sphingobium baderi]|uniref:Feruloyl esterase n=1 Tax=Sphingobium baderi TaxID=1332080 RepID=A0A0S3EYU6_9SPHN|nr:tannase/feruloyl esterase family alpha/beta hydrolase [Sphingobium baderi]ALR20556.1 hypothetical protein ATN00_09805 [Sphingobium baderi]